MDTAVHIQWPEEGMGRIAEVRIDGDTVYQVITFDGIKRQAVRIWQDAGKFHITPCSRSLVDLLIAVVDAAQTVHKKVPRE